MQRKYDDVRKEVLEREYICTASCVPLFTTAGRPGKALVCVARYLLYSQNSTVSQPASLLVSEQDCEQDCLSVATKAACKGPSGVLREQQL